MTVYTIIIGVFIVGFAVLALASFLIWVDEHYPEQDEHSDTDNSRG